MTETEILTYSPAETLLWAADFARTLESRAVVALYGELGAGKTVIAKGIGRGLSVREEIISPTFNYVLEYAGRVKLFHADLYRIEDATVFRAMGLEEYFERDGVLVIEWAEKVRELLPPETIEITIESEGDTRRRITVKRKSDAALS
ncbi:tRNA (adenosine(37)-N6)-threonylcarbamoyltransferase complex ATPase subunit type 1 TsaE [bacterium]|nr:tRNA (adenosine(37)-N6)-threonylcarbamoyltransferase complex ATPase subunit type 1 TsaE [bacterium]MBU1983044.1 tRNA (adenosine(37)-N6)-threonylcarbamoyltransferase complex ATPase subunit type 1 TsaE [bacterium]